MEPRYGHWTLLDPNDYRDTVPCQCDCGTTRNIRRRELLAGTTTSCGCQRGARLRGKTWNTQALAPETSTTITQGNRFGRWTIIGEPQPRGKRRVVLCQCDCGNQNHVGTDNLLKGVSKSCGCLKRDAGRALHT